MKKPKLLIAYVLLGFIAIYLFSGCKKPQTCQKCTIYTKLTNSNTYSQENYLNCQPNDLTGTESISKNKSGQIIARKTYVCDGLITQ